MTSHCVNVFSRGGKCIYLVKFLFFNAEKVIKANRHRGGCETLICSDCGSPSGAVFYASEVGKTLRMVIRKNITLVG